MTRYLISFGAHAMDHIPDEDMPAVAKAAHAVVQEAVNAGVFVCGGGLEDQRASIVATDGTVTDGPYPEAIGGLTVVEVPSREEALKWAAKIAVACRCAQAGPGVRARPRTRRDAPPGRHTLELGTGFVPIGTDRHRAGLCQASWAGPAGLLCARTEGHSG